MNRADYVANEAEYIAELEKALKKRNVEDIGDVIEEYRQHFANKLADGYSEAEIIAKLATPQNIALQFTGDAPAAMNFSRILLSVGMALLDMFVGAGAVLLFSWVLVLFASALSTGAIGISLITGLGFVWNYVTMPYLGALLLGIACLSIGVISAVGGIYSYLYIVQWARAYLRWHKGVFHKSVYPALPMTPQLQPKTKRRLRLVMVISLMSMGIAFILGYLVLALSTGAMEFWHALGWFV